MEDKLVIGLSGPVGVGKSWFAEEASELLAVKYGVTAYRLSPRDFIWEEFSLIFGIDESLEAFKEAHPIFYRDGMIALAKKRRREDVHYWVKRFIQQLSYHHQLSVFINDSIAFLEEHEFLTEHVPNHVTVVIAPPDYKPGDFYDDSYRRCVEPTGGFRTATSSGALIEFKKRIENAQHYLEEGNLAGVARVLGVKSNTEPLSR